MTKQSRDRKGADILDFRHGLLGALENTLSEGLVSGKRQLEGYQILQISAPISQGSSGAPLVSTEGKVVGVVAASISEGQNLNFAVPIDYVRGLLTANTTQPLSAIYEPPPVAQDKKHEESEPEKPVSKVTPESVKPGPSAATVAQFNVAIPRPSEDLQKRGIVYVESKLFKWTLDDAVVEFGRPTGNRPALTNGQVSGTIYSFIDPTRNFVQYELSFSNDSKLMTMVIAYPLNVALDDVKKLFGEDFQVQDSPNGEKMLTYRNRRLLVRLDKSERVISLGVY